MTNRLCPSAVLQVLKNRRLINSITNINEALSHSTGSSVYVGFDPSGDSLHLGHLLTIIPLIHFQQHGYQPIAVVGGATVLVGDPSGRDTERTDVFKNEQIEQRIINFSSTLSQIFSNALKLVSSQSAQPVLRILNNADWYRDINIVDFLSQYGRHFRISTMIKKESVQKRLQSQEGLSFTEFSYQVLQAYDFMHLHKNHSTWLQIGGGDQWGNIVSGCDLIHKLTDSQVNGLTVPLLTSPNGEKFSKTAGNAVWLSPNETSPYQLYQYFLNISDDQVETFLHYFTFTSIEDITSLMKDHGSSPEKRLAQTHLAEQVTLLVHGEVGLEQAVNASGVLFGDDQSFLKISKKDIQDIFSDVPSSEMSFDCITSSTKVTDVLKQASILSSKGEVSRLIKSGGVYINNEQLTFPGQKWSHDNHVIHDNITIVRIGKKRYHLIKWS